MISLHVLRGIARQELEFATGMAKGSANEKERAAPLISAT